jgi:hypothetical protein
MACPNSCLNHGLWTTGVGDRQRRFPACSRCWLLLIFHAIESSDDEIVVVRMNGVATFDRLVAVEQFVEQTFSASGEDFLRQDFEMTEGPEQNDAFGKCKPDASQSIWTDYMQYAGAEFVHDHESSLTLNQF